MLEHLLTILARCNLFAGVAVIAVLAARPLAARLFGARIAYALWATPLVAALAGLLPGPAVTVAVIGQKIAPVAPRVVEWGSEGVNAVALGPPIGFFTLLALVWAAGAGASLYLVVRKQRRFLAALGKLHKVEGALFQAERAGIGPAAFGLLSPRIVLPADFTVLFTPEEQRLMLAHERGHLPVDTRVNAVMAALQCLNWFNPLVHIAAFHMRMDQELACDAAVVAGEPQGRRAYAEAMLKAQLAPIALPLGCYWPSASKRRLNGRIRMLLRGSPSQAMALAGAGLAAMLAVGVGYGAWAMQPARPVMVSIEGRRLAPDALSHGLVAAAARGDAKAVEALIRSGADVDHRWMWVGTPLVMAARRGDLAMTRLLLERGADPNEAIAGNGNPLIVAAAAGHLDVAAELVRHGADVNASIPGDETPLINAARAGRLEMVKFLVANGADLNLSVAANPWPGSTQRSALSEALKWRRSEVVAYLKASGAKS